MKQQEILKKIIPELKMDSSITGVMLMGSVAMGRENADSDLDLYILGKKNKFDSELIDDILVDYFFINHETAQSRLDRSGMEVYYYIGSKILYDMDGKLIRLMRSAMCKYKNYKVNDREKKEIRHWLYSTKSKINTSMEHSQPLKVNFITTTTSWKIVEAVFAVNEIPLPPTCRIMQELSNLKQLPTEGWFYVLFGTDIKERTKMMLNIIEWALMML